MGELESVGLSGELLSQESRLFDHPSSIHHLHPPPPQPPKTTQPSTSSNSPLFTVFPSNPSLLEPSHTSHSPSSSSTTSGSSSSKRKAAASTGHEDEDKDKALKRQRNTLAARKYRQKRLDRIAELEKALEDMQGERDDLKLKLVRREAEVDALREMLGRK